MQVAIVGTGAIGSTFAFHLAKAGHAVTAVARAARLVQLQRDHAIVKVTGERAAVAVRATLDPNTAWDLVLVTTRANQVQSVLPMLQVSDAKTVMFMFNTFEPLQLLREAVGPARTAFGFPVMYASLSDGRLKSQIPARGALTTVSDIACAKLYSDAGIPSCVHNGMESWLRSHAALVVPLMAFGNTVRVRGSGISWAEAITGALALTEGFDAVRSLGNEIVPSGVEKIARLPRALLPPLFWVLSRTPMVRAFGAAGPEETRTLIDSMVRLAKSPTEALRTLRP
jgi:2-dehydropantoate 2-reductase